MLSNGGEGETLRVRWSKHARQHSIRLYWNSAGRFTTPRCPVTYRRRIVLWAAGALCFFGDNSRKPLNARIHRPQMFTRTPQQSREPVDASPYTGWNEKLAPFLYALTSSNIDQFSNLFPCQDQEKICSNIIAIDPTTPQMWHIGLSVF